MATLSSLDDKIAMPSAAPVSVVIPCYNAGKTIEYALESVERQTVPVYEILCIDDCSTDATWHVLQQFKAAHPNMAMRILQTPRNSGPSVARNLGWEEARGDYIAFLDADDLWHSEKIAFQYQWMRDHPTVPMSGHRYCIIDPDAVPPELPTQFPLTAYPVSRHRLLLSNPFVTPAVMLKRSLPYRFDPNRRYCEDYFLWLQLMSDGLEMVMLETTLVYVRKRVGVSGTSRHLWRMRTGDIYNYWQLWRSGRLNFFVMNGLVGYSILKFLVLLILGPQRHFAIKQRIDSSVSR